MEVWSYVFITTSEPKRVLRAVRLITGVIHADALLGGPDVVAIVSGSTIAEMVKSMEYGSCYLMEEEKPEKSLQIFEALLKKGIKGVMVTRDFPDKLRKKYELGDSRIFWLSNTDAKDTFKPVELGKLYYNLEEFLKINRFTVRPGFSFRRKYLGCAPIICCRLCPLRIAPLATKHGVRCRIAAGELDDHRRSAWS